MMFRILSLPFRVLGFALWFAGAILRSSAQVLADILSPGHGATPRIVRMPLGRATDRHVTMISIFITLTPGTLTIGSIDEPDGERTILVHSMYHPSTAAALTDLHDMDRRMMRSVTIGEPA